MTQTSRLLELSAFPIVRLRIAGQPPGYASLWVAEMEALLQRCEPFVLLADEPHGEESHEDRKAKTLWFKANKAALASMCRGLIVVEPDAVRRAAMRVQGLALSKAFGLKFNVVADVGQAELIAARLLSDARSA